MIDWLMLVVSIGWATDTQLSDIRYEAFNDISGCVPPALGRG